jgi:hypothetical protein
MLALLRCFLHLILKDVVLSLDFLQLVFKRFLLCLDLFDLFDSSRLGLSFSLCLNLISTSFGSLTLSIQEFLLKVSNLGCQLFLLLLEIGLVQLRLLLNFEELLVE